MCFQINVVTDYTLKGYDRFTGLGYVIHKLYSTKIYPVLRIIEE